MEWYSVATRRPSRGYRLFALAVMIVAMVAAATANVWSSWGA